MTQKRQALPAPRFRVGDKVKWNYGSIPVLSEISEDRGNLGHEGEHVYGVWFTLPDSERTYTEIPESELEPAA